MSAFKQKLARLGATAGVVAGATAAIFAVGGASASTALAAECVNVPESVRALKGEGSTLQNVAQGNWTGAYNTACSGAENAHFTYTGTGSGAALTAFAYNGSTLNTGEAYVGTDDAPNATQIANAKSHAGTARPVIIPVAQTSISVVANIPQAKCKPTGGINYADLTKLFAGTITKWSQISTVNKAECEAAEASESGAITRVVREDGSGTSYQFKNYLNILATTLSGVGPGSVKISTTCETKTWEQLEETTAPNLTWPQNTGEGGCQTGLSPLVRKKGGGGVAEYVAATKNTIGYASYSDAFAKKATSLSLQNGTGKSGATYAVPGIVPTGGTEATEANCSTRTYTVASGAFTGEGLEKDWSKVFGAVPSIGGTAYPLCTLTYDLAWKGYAGAGYTEGAKVGAAVHAYIGYELGEGQAVLGQNGYAKLPETAEESHNVLGAAKFALASVN
jgi:ABC-type phosphate transport system substrate-binding protein